MTRQDFLDNVTTWYDLVCFCSDESCDYCDDIYTEELRDDYIDECLRDMASNANGWRGLRDDLNDIETGYEYYRSTDYGWRGLENGDDDFDTYKEDIRSNSNNLVINGFCA